MNPFRHGPRIAIVGAGGVGGYLAGMLANAGLDVTLIARPPHVAVLAAEGLVLKTSEREIRVPQIKAVDSIAKLGQVDVVLLTTKTYDLAESLTTLPAHIRRSAIFITFQNGIDNDLLVRNLHSEVEAYPGLAYIVSAKKSPGLIEQSAGPKKFMFGDRLTPENQKLESLAGIMRDAGIDCTAVPDIEKQLWTKFIWILGFAGVTAALRSPIGTIVNDAWGLDLFAKSVDEGLAVAGALNVPIGESEREMVLAKAEGYKTKGCSARASLAVDLIEGRPTEIEALHGALLRLSHSVGISVPTIEMLYHTIRFAETGRTSP